MMSSRLKTAGTMAFLLAGTLLMGACNSSNNVNTTATGSTYSEPAAVQPTTDTGSRRTNTGSTTAPRNTNTTY